MLFLILAPSIVLYCQGYRFDFDSKKITQTGGLFLKISPKQTDIYLDNRLKEKTDFFFGSALVENLLPRKYQIKVQKDGYSSWEKSLEIKEKQVTEAKNIILFPTNLNFTVVSNSVLNFWFSSDERKIILEENTPNNGWALKLYDLNKNLKSHLIYATDISRKGAELLNLTFSDDPNQINLTLGINEQSKNFSLRLDTTPPPLNEIKNNSTTSPDIIISKKINNDLYSLNNVGFLLKNQGKLNETAFPVQAETDYDISVATDNIFLKENNNLFLLNSTTKSFEKFFDNVVATKLSQDNQKMLYFSAHEIWLLFLQDELSQPQRKAGDKILLLRLADEIRNCSWLNSDYLIFNKTSQIQIIEIDNRDKPNVAEIKNPAENAGDITVYWNKTDGKIYILGNNILYQSAILLP